jgi:hypothetical protein
LQCSGDGDSRRLHRAGCEARVAPRRPVPVSPRVARILRDTREREARPG